MSGKKWAKSKHQIYCEIDENCQPYLFIMWSVL